MIEGAERPELRTLDDRVVNVWRAGSLVRAAALSGLVLAVELLLGTPWPSGIAGGAALVVGTAYGAVWPGLRHRAWGYRVHDEDLYLRHGVVWRTESVVPHTRIQHVDVRRGPLDRWLGLARVVVFTAGSRGAMVEVPGLDAGDAEALRDRLIALSGAGDAV